MVRAKMLESFVNGVLGSCATVLIACAITTHYKAARYLDFSLAAMATIGGYAAYSASATLGFPLGATLLASGLLGTVIGIALQFTVFAPLHDRRASRSVLLLSSLGTYLVLINFLGVVFGSATRVPRPGVAFTVTFFDVTTPLIRWELLLGTVVTLMVVTGGLHFTRANRVLKACFDSPELIVACGHDRASLRLAATAVATLLCAVAGAVVAIDTGVQPSSSLNLFLTATVAAIAGGLGRTTGAILTAIVFSCVKAMASLAVPGQWIEPVALSAVLIVLSARPGGLLGSSGIRGLS